MKHKKNILLIILIISSLTLILFPKSIVASVDDVRYTFENDNLFDSDITEIDYNWGSPPIAKLQNVRNSSSMTNQTYNAFYTFTNDTDYDNPIAWDIDETGGSINVFPSLDGHDKIIELNDTSGVDTIILEQDFTDGVQTSGTIEYWIRSNDVDTITTTIIQNNVGGGSAILFYVRDDLFKHYDGAVFQTVPASPIPIDNQWYHIRMDFECGGGGYMGLGADEYYLYINGHRYGDFDLRLPAVSIKSIVFYAQDDSDIFKFYVDAIDYSWEVDYNFWRNTIPMIDTNTDIKEVNRYEFAFSSFQVQYPLGGDIFSGWTEIEDGGDDVNTAINSDWNSDRVINIDFDGVDFQDIGIYKEFSNHGDFLNLTWALEFTTLENWCQFETNVYSFDNTLIAEVDINNLNQLRSLQPTTTHYVGLAENEYYEFNLYINYRDNQAILMFYIDGVYENTYYFALIASGKEGLGKIEFILDGFQLFLMDVDLDYVGVYIEEASICDWFGYLRTEGILPPLQTWYLDNHDIFSFTFDNPTLSSFWVSEQIYFPFISSITQIVGLDTYDSNNRVSVYGLSVPVSDPIIWCQFYGSIQANLEFKIDGSRLVEGVNEYSLELTSGSVDLTESYFYVLDNKLHFTLTTNDTNTEYIQATFDILNLSSTDRAISFRGFRLNKAFGYFVVDYLIGITTVDIPIIEKTTRAILPTNKTIDTFVILITDNDVDSIIGTTTGFVSRPILLRVSGIGLPIITAGLMEMMIPLLLIMIPTLLISQGFGKEGKKLIIPLFLVFSLITTITEIIPVWIFFIIAFGNSLFLFRNKEIEG